MSERQESLVGTYGGGRLAEWLEALKRPAQARHDIEDWAFPTDELRDEYLDTLESRSEEEIRWLLRLFLFESTNFGLDEAHRRAFLAKDPAVRGRLLQEHEYYWRLATREVPTFPGIRWVLDLLPHWPRLAIQAIEAYLLAHAQVLPDGRINGLDDAAAIIRARYIGRPQDTEARRLSLFDLTPRDFERLIAALYSELGYETELTPPRKDGGRDVLASRRDVGHSEDLRIECKLYQHNVGVSTMRALLGVVSDEKVNKGVLVSSAGYSRAAEAFAARNPRLELIDGHALVALLNEEFGAQWPVRIDTILRKSREQHAE